MRNRTKKTIAKPLTTEEVQAHTAATIKEAVERLMKQDAALTLEAAQAEAERVLAPKTAESN